MYGQGNYGPQFMHGPPPPAPAPPPLQQGHPPPPPVLLHQGPPPPPPPIQHGLTAPPPPIQQGPPAPPHYIQQGHVHPILINPPGMVNMGQPYLPPHPVHGRAPVLPSYSTTQQNPHYTAPMPLQNVHHGQPSGPPLLSPSPPEIIQGQLPPRVLPPPPPSQGQMLYRTPPMPLNSVMMQVPQPIQPPPPPPSGFVPVTPPYPAFIHEPISDAHPPSMPPPPPPPPPSSPPPSPPSPPPLASPPPNLPGMVSDAASLNSTDSAVDTSRRLESSGVPDGSTERLTDSADSVERNSGPSNDTAGAAQSAGNTIQKMDHVMADVFSSSALALKGLPAPPLKPMDDVVSRNIELLCQFIAKAGPDFEKMARTKEVGNPRFAFLFGGEPGSDAAIGHEYFQWMKKKHLLELSLRDEFEQNDQSLRTLGMEPIPQLSNLVDERFADSPEVSDMDMEDDVNTSNNGPEVDQLIEDLDGETVSAIVAVADVKEQFHLPDSPRKQSIPEDAVTGDMHWTGSSALHAGQGKEVDADSAPARPLIEDLSPVKVSPEATYCTSNVQESARSLIQVSSPAKAAPASVEVSGSSNNDGGLFKLIPDYASDDTADDDGGPYIEDVSPFRVSPSVTVCASDGHGLHENVGEHVHSSLDFMNLSATGTGSALNFDSDILDPSKTPLRATETVQDSDGSPVSLKAASPSMILSEPLDSPAEINELGIHEIPDKTLTDYSSEKIGTDIGHEIVRFHEDEDLKQVSPKLKVDEFGRLVREGCSDSDSDGPLYPERRRKRRRSRSRSQSPYESRRRRSHSPWRRRDKRSRSHSWSPKKQRSRSKSPASYRRVGEYVGEKGRWDRSQTPVCFDFLRGRCYRGVSCRFLHRDTARDNAKKQHSDRFEQLQESFKEFKNSIMGAEESKNVATEKTFGGNSEERKSEEVKTAQDLSVDGDGAKIAMDLEENIESVSVRDSPRPTVSGELGQAPVTEDAGQSQGSQETIVQVLEMHQVQEVQEGPSVDTLVSEISQQSVEIPPHSTVNTFPSQPLPVTEPQCLHIETPPIQPFSGEDSVLQPSQASDSGLNVQNPAPHLQPMEGSSASHSFPGQDPLPQPYPPDQAPVNPQYQPNQGLINEPLPLQRFGSQPLPPQEFYPPNSSGDFRFQPPQVPSAPHPPQPSRDYQLQPPVGNFLAQPAPIDRLPPFQPPSANYQSQIPPTNLSWTGLPPPPPLLLPPPPLRNELPPNATISAADLRPLTFQQNSVTYRSDFPQYPPMRPYLPEDPSHIRPGDSHSRIFPSTEEPHRNHLPMEEFRSRLLPVENPRDQPFGVSGVMREERFLGSTGDSMSFSRPRENFAHQPLPREEVRVGQFPFREDLQNLQRIPNSRFGSQFSGQGFSSGAFAQEIVHSQPPLHFPREVPNLRDDLPSRTFPREDFNSASYARNFYSQHQKPPSGLQDPLVNGFSSQFNAPGSIEAGIPTSNPIVRSHYNPFASTFEQVRTSSAFDSGVFRQEIENISNISGSKYASQLGSSRVSVGGQGTGGLNTGALGLPQHGSPSDSSRLVGQFLPRSDNSLPSAPSGEPSDFMYPREPSAVRRSGEPPQFTKESAAGDQYDPLFDSIEPSSNEGFRKLDRVQEREASTEAANKSITDRDENESGIAPRSSGLTKPMDVVENNKRKEVPPAVFKLSENDEFGEVAIDAKVGAVDNGSPVYEAGDWSPGQAVDLGNTAVGDVEIDQVHNPGKSKKSKDSRSMKLFKIALADFVKEILKPSWRQGNMSKEAFKTIVKKTVDKVSGTMQSYQIPKGQGKINQYVESSQRKLTKLVMGYVDKYVKA